MKKIVILKKKKGIYIYPLKNKVIFKERVMLELRHLSLFHRIKFIIKSVVRFQMGVILKNY